ncbi:hypothetical protein CPB84DRAFT_1809166 [Gymnopilus junonius]|uniref:Uncharacterized protein n=1 Tax=Gymnopilus junonius TaxID=109634 RepID=A0A9P5TF90_GYMJU|nr:hypothetical protein CPB84DRAFT_1809166 [Gymnopilus junonius]
MENIGITATPSVMSSTRKVDKTEGEIGVYYISDPAYQEYKHRCNSVWYCSKEVKSLPEHKGQCGTLEVIEALQPRVSRFLKHPGLLHHLRVALILSLGLFGNTRSDECLNAIVMLQVIPNSHRQYFELLNGISLNIPKSKQRPDVALLVNMWKRARKIATDAGRKDNPILVVDFNYYGQDIPLGIEITREAFLTVLGMPIQPSFALILKKKQVLEGMTKESIIEKINQFIEDDAEDKLGLQIEMREYDKDFICKLGQIAGLGRST